MRPKKKKEFVEKKKSLSKKKRVREDSEDEGEQFFSLAQGGKKRY